MLGAHQLLNPVDILRFTNACRAFRFFGQQYAPAAKNLGNNAGYGESRMLGLNVQLPSHEYKVVIQSHDRELNFGAASSLMFAQILRPFPLIV